MERTRRALVDGAWIVLGAALFALGFDLFLRPAEISGGGLSGIALIVSRLTGLQALGAFLLACNVPLFLLGWRRLGRRFVLGSLLGMAVSSVLLDVFALLPGLAVEPLLAALYGGGLVGLGLGLVFARGASTGGTDIVARLIRRRAPHLPMGRVLLAMDCAVVLLNGVVFRDVDKTLYSAVALAVMSVAVDGVLYGRSNAGVALIVSRRPRAIAEAIDARLGRGATLLPAEGAYTGTPRAVLLCAVRASEVGRLQSLVAEVDREAFLILQKARQVLGQGFGRYGDGP